MGARRERDAWADGLDHPRALVAKHRGTGRLGGAVDRVEVRVADAAGAQPDEHLALRGRRQVELRQLERSTHPLEDRGANLQGPFSPAAAAARGPEVS